jgi:hypothetical protein
MLRSFKQLIIPIVLAALAASFPIQTRAQSQSQEKKPSLPVPEKETRRTQFPFRGKIGAVDASAMTITLEGKERKRKIQVTSQTRILKDGKVAKITDAMVGEEVGGVLTRTADGKEEAVSLRLGPKPESKTAAQEESAGKTGGNE